MLRLIHNQTVQGGILVDDIDDGLPNKEVHRLGSTADPKAYERDGYANKPKQACYVPFSQATKGFPTIPGYINVSQTNKVTLSAGKGKIYKLSTAPGSPKLITVVSLTAAQVAKPAISAAVHGNPTTITGTTFLSVAPDISSVTFAQGTGVSAPVPATLTQAQIIAASGTFSATSISIPSAAFTTAPVAGNTVFVTANEQNSNTQTLT